MKYEEKGRLIVFFGDNIPAHDKTFALASVIGDALDQFASYVTTVRDQEQADLAVWELLTKLLDGDFEQEGK